MSTAKKIRAAATGGAVAAFTAALTWGGLHVAQASADLADHDWLGLAVLLTSGALLTMTAFGGHVSVIAEEIRDASRQIGRTEE